MKNVMLFFSLFIVLVIFIGSCSKDDSISSNKLKKSGLLNDSAGLITDTIVIFPLDTVYPNPVDTIYPVPIDTIYPNPLDTVYPYPVDTIYPIPEDSVYPVPVDPAYPVPTDSVSYNN